MNKVGIYYAYWEKEWSADFIPYIKKAKKLGFDILEINAGAIVDMTSLERKALVDVAKSEGVKLTYCIGLPNEYNLASFDENVRNSGIEFVLKILDCMYEMGGDTLGGIIYAAWPMANTPTYEEKLKMRELSLDSLRKIAPRAEKYGISYCLEVVNRFEQCILNTAQEAIEYVKELNSPAVKILLDTFHMNIEEDSIADAIRSAKGYLGHFHIGEPNRKTPGTGRMPWNEIFEALADIDYRGAICMEPFIRVGGQVGKDIKVFRDLSNGATDEQMDILAQNAAKFVKESIK